MTCDGWDKQQEQMSIRLKSADNDDVLLWSPRIGQAAQAFQVANHHLILRNSRLEGDEWQDQEAEIDGTWPLGDYGSPFSVDFMFEQEVWRISIAGAGVLATLYPHRIEKPVVRVELENVTKPVLHQLNKAMMILQLVDAQVVEKAFVADLCLISGSLRAHVTLSNFEEMKVDDLLQVASIEAEHLVTELNIVTQTGRNLDYTSSDMLLQDIFPQSLLSAASAAGVSARA